MAYVKIKNIKTTDHLQRIIHYIKNPDKTDGGNLISSFGCSLSNTAKEFEETLKRTRHYGNNIAHHICQSFSPEDNVTPEQALEIGQEMMKRMYPDFQFLICTHIDCDHTHNHIVMCAANFRDYKKVHSNSENLKALRKVSDTICEEKGISVIVSEEKNKREKLKNDIDEAIENSNNFEEFLGYMQFKKYEIKREKYLCFKGRESNVFFNTKLLGTAYTENNIRKRVENNNIQIENHKVHIYDDKLVKMSYRKRLKFAIDNTLKKAKDYDDFLKILRAANYEIKFGKHLAFKHSMGERFIRVENLGTEYSEDMLKLYFSNNEEYQALKKESEETKIDKVITSDTAYRNRYIESKNVNIQIRALNYLKEKGISSIDELNAKLEEAQKQTNINNRNIQNINTQISEKKEIVKSLRAYWQFEPVIAEIKRLKTKDEKEKYKAEKRNQIERYNKAVEIINRSKNPDGTLPKTADINIEIEKLEKLKENISIKNNKIKNKLSNYKNIKHNIEQILADDTALEAKNKNRKIEKLL